MARKSGKKAGKSGKTGPGKSIKDAEPSPARPAPRKAVMACEFCGKAMKDGRTLKIHQRNCGSKPAPKKEEKDLESKVLELRDRFDEDRESLFKTFQDREDHLQRELEEVKTVLRLEMDRHRRELERISKVERDVAAKQDASGAPSAEDPPEKPGPEPAGVPAKEPEAPEPAKPRNGQPRAIDLIPMRVPSLPRRKLPPMDDDDAIPDLDVAPEPARPAPGPDREAVEAMVRDILDRRPPEKEPAGDDGALSGKMAQLSGRLDALDSKMERAVSELRKQFDRVGNEAGLKKLDKELEKVSERVQDMMEDSGYGESLSVTKIPPTILEIVYQAILDDVHMEIIRTKGPQDAEKVARSALEEVRLKTSGSELFKFDGRKIVTDNLAKSIEANLISAKQIQTTYDVLMEKLLETVPHHKAKNFKGMIKVKSQEFAVDRATRLTKDAVRLERNLESLNQMVAAMSANANSQTMGIHEQLKRIEESELPSKPGMEDLNALRAKLDEVSERIIALSDDMTLMKADAEMKASIREREEEAAGDVFLAPGEEPEPSVPEGGMFSALKPEGPEEDGTVPVLEAVAKGLDSKAAIARETGLDRDEVARLLSELVGAKKVIEKKAGKRVRYTTLALEMGKLTRMEPDVEPAKPAPADTPADTPGVIVLEDTEPEPPAPEEAPQAGPEPPARDEQTKHSGPGVIVLDDSQDEPAKPSRKKAKARKPEKPALKKAGKAPKPGKPAAKKAVKASEPEVQEPGKPVVKKAVKASEPEVQEPGKPAAKPKEPEPAPQPEAAKPERATDELPAVVKSLEELSGDESAVLEAVTRDGVTLSGIQSKVGKRMKRFELLRALRMLIDSGHVGITAKGRMELYQRITVQQMDEQEKEKNKKEVK